MAWSMHPGHHDDEVQSQWHRPPPAEDGQAARIHAPKARSLLVERTGSGPNPTR